LKTTLTLLPDEIKEALAGNICKCGVSPMIIESVLEAASKSKGG
jgi:aerobic-type carbon monoxide dehydrogenase small subunit (CoxS/CutS family)